MHFQFKARLGSNEIQILLSKDMSVQEMLDAFSYALQLPPFSQIVGFRDPSTSLIIPPSILCSDPNKINLNEVYEILIRQIPQSSIQNSIGVSANPVGSALQNQISVQTSAQNAQFSETHASFNARIQKQQRQNIGDATGSSLINEEQIISIQGQKGAIAPASQLLQNNFEVIDKKIKNLNKSQELLNKNTKYINTINSNQEFNVRSGNQAQQIIREQQRGIESSQQYGFQEIRGQSLINYFQNNNNHSRQPSTAPSRVEREKDDINNQYSNQTKQIIMELIESWQTDALLTDQLKQRMIQKVQNDDPRIFGAYRLFLNDRDVEGFKARIIHKFIGGHLGTAGNNTNLILSAEERQSSITTAGFNRSADYLSRFSRGSTGQGTNNGGYNVQNPYGAIGSSGLNTRPQTHARFQRFVRPATTDQNNQSDYQQFYGNDHNNRSGVKYLNQSSQDRYLPIIINLEQQNILDEQLASLLKTLILEENLEIFRIINSYIAQAIDVEELCQKLTFLAQQMNGFFIVERPMSPIPKNKKKLLAFVNSLTRYHFSSKDDIELLNQLIQEENEFVLSCFDVFDSDKDHENLIDSLQRILDKTKQNEEYKKNRGPNWWNYPEQENQVNPQFSNHQQQRYNNRSGAIYHQAPQQNHSFGISSTIGAASSINNLAQNSLNNIHQNNLERPPTSQWIEQPNGIHRQQLINQAANQIIGLRTQSLVRPEGMIRGQSQNKNEIIRDRVNNRIQRNLGNQVAGNRKRDLSHGVVVQCPQFQPQPTTVQNVPLIPGYFSSGDEEIVNSASQKQNQSNFLYKNGQYNQNLKFIRTNFDQQQKLPQQYKQSFQSGTGKNFMPQKNYQNFTQSNQKQSNFKQIQQKFPNQNLGVSNFGRVNNQVNASHQEQLDERYYYIENQQNYSKHSGLQKQGTRIDYPRNLHNTFDTDDEHRQQKPLGRRGTQYIPAQKGQRIIYDNYIQEEQSQLQENFSYGQYYQEDGNQNYDFVQSRFGPSIVGSNQNFINSLVDFDEYGEEIINNNGFLATQPPLMPHTATFFSDSKNQANTNNIIRAQRQQIKKSKVRQEANKRITEYQGQKNKRQKPKKKYSSEEDAQELQENNFVKYQRREMGGYVALGEDNDSDYDVNERVAYYGQVIENDYIQQQNSDQVSGQTDFSEESSQSSEASSSERSSSHEGSSASKKQIKKDKKGVKKQQRKQGSKKKEKKGKDKKKEKKEKKKKDQKNKNQKAGNYNAKIQENQTQNHQIYQQRPKNSRSQIQIDYWKIIESEKLSQKLRIDNFGILLYLIENEDYEVRQTFQNHLIFINNNKSPNEQSNLLSEITAKTEETYQMILEKAMSNEEQNIIRQKRNLNNQDYILIMRSFINKNQGQLNLENLISDYRDLVKIHNKTQKLINDNEHQESAKNNSQFPNDQKLLQQQQVNYNRQKQLSIEQREKIEQVFLSILYDSFKGKPDKEKFLRQQFQAQNQELFQILLAHTNNPNIQQLRVQISKFVYGQFGPDIYQSLREAINGLFERGFISIQDRDLIKQLSFKDDKHLMAAWEVYSVLQDEEDLIDTLKVLAEVKRKSANSNLNNQNGILLNEQENQKQAYGFIQIMPGSSQDKNVKQIQNIQNEKITQTKIPSNQKKFAEEENDLPQSQIIDQEKQIENKKFQQAYQGELQQPKLKIIKEKNLLISDENQKQATNIISYTQINTQWTGQPVIRPQISPLESMKDDEEQNNLEGQNYQNLSSGQRQMQSEDFAFGYSNNREDFEDQGEDQGEGDEDGDQDCEDIESIVQYQHKILRKYAMLGMIQYSAIPFFHQLVQNRDYKMICIFEVFAQNRNEDDFLENLGILDEIRIRHEEEEHNLLRYQNQQIQINSADQKNSSNQDDIINEDGFDQQFNISLQLNQRMIVQNSQRNEDIQNNEDQNDSGIVISENIDNPQYLSDQRKNYGAGDENQEYDEGPKMNSYSMNFNFSREQQTTNQNQESKQDNSRKKEINEKTNNIQIHLNFGNDQQSQQIIEDNSQNLLKKSVQGEESPQKIQDSKSLNEPDPNIQLLNQVRNQLQIGEFEWIKQKLIEQDKKFVTLVKCFKMTNDSADFINSIQRFYKKAQQ